MCGLFGAIGHDLDRSLLGSIAEQAGRRGPNAWGMAWLANGQMHRFAQPGKLSASINKVNNVLGQEVHAVIGQSRLATSGTYRENANNPPFVLDTCALVHNGNVYNERELVTQYQLTPLTQCDSEVLAQLVFYRRQGGTLLERVIWAVQQVEKRSPLAALVLDETGLVAVRIWHPLFSFTDAVARTAYVCSRAFHAQATMLPDRTASFWSHDGQMVTQQEVR